MTQSLAATPPAPPSPDVIPRQLEGTGNQPSPDVIPNFYVVTYRTNAIFCNGTDLSTEHSVQPNIASLNTPSPDPTSDGKSHSYRVSCNCRESHLFWSSMPSLVTGRIVLS